MTQIEEREVEIEKDKDTLQKYKNYNQYADEYKDMFEHWIKLSNIELSKFVEYLNSSDLDIRHEGLQYGFYIGDKLYGLPFIPDGNNIDNFKIDLSLLLMHMASYCKKEEKYNYIKRIVMAM